MQDFEVVGKSVARTVLYVLVSFYYYYTRFLW